MGIKSIGSDAPGNNEYSVCLDGENDSPATVYACSAYEAARAFAEYRHAQDDYPDHQIVVVSFRGNTRRFDVEATPSVMFHAAEIEE